MKNINNEILELKKAINELNNQIFRQKIRTDRVVQVLRTSLPKNVLNKPINFSGQDCQGRFIYMPSFAGYTLDDFLYSVIDP